ncbi:MAG: hypothetical protein Q8P02_04020 [Candidatus Micrarchaeota archaeon]|nr:hypothetical protein [Candidatus Micrarchaeota archaeon]
MRENTWHLKAAVSLPESAFKVEASNHDGREYDNAEYICSTAVHRKSGMKVDFFSTNMDGGKKPVFRIRLPPQRSQERSQTKWFDASGTPMNIPQNLRIRFKSKSQKKHFEAIRQAALSALKENAP